MNSVKIGDLVRMKTHDTGLVGLVVDKYPRCNSTHASQIGIKWLLCPGRPLRAGPIQWEPEAWLEVVSESR